MKSQWYHLKNIAISLRKKGFSLRDVEAKLKIPKSTLSYWFKYIKLNPKQKKRLLENWKQALGKARKKAVIWHNSQKEARIVEARRQALETLDSINISHKYILDLALAMLYLGEGSKSSPETVLGSSSPMILKFFIKALWLVYGLESNKIRCELHLRADQNAKLIKSYWSKELGISLINFTSVSFDPRTKGSPTYKTYKGVCVLRCSNVAIQRKLMFLAEEFCRKVILH